MALFKKNQNEEAFVGGQKNWVDVIRNSGAGELMFWRQPEEDFNTNSTLIVMPGEEAVFIKGGQIEQVFTNGTYKLSTENYPFISRLRTVFSGGISTFNCVVYFFRKADSREILWGTDSPIQVRDKVFNIRTDARVRGAYKVRIENSELFLKKLVGNNVLPHTQDDLQNYFLNEFQGRIKSVLSNYLNSLNIELIGIQEYIYDISSILEPIIDGIFNEYGLKCAKFSLSGLDIDTTKYDLIDEAQLDYIKTIREAEGKKGMLDILGANWHKLEGAKILSELAQNPSGGIASATAGIGLGFGVGGAFGSMAQPYMSSFLNNTTQEQPQSQVPINNMQMQTSRFTQKDTVKEENAPKEQLAQQPIVKENPVEVLTELKKLLELDLITQEEFNNKKTEVLSRM